MTELMIELEPQQILALKQGIDWVERGTGGQSTVVSYWADSAEHKITYADDAAAIAAMDLWLAELNRAPAGGLVVGDAVLVSHHNHARGALGEQIEALLLAFPTPGFPFWVVQTATETMYVDNVTVSKKL